MHTPHAKPTNRQTIPLHVANPEIRNFKMSSPGISKKNSPANQISEWPHIGLGMYTLAARRDLSTQTLAWMLKEEGFRAPVNSTPEADDRLANALTLS